MALTADPIPQRFAVSEGPDLLADRWTDRRLVAAGRVALVLSVAVWIGATALVVAADGLPPLSSRLGIGLPLGVWSGFLFWFVVAAAPRNRLVWLLVGLHAVNAILALCGAVLVQATAARGLPFPPDGVAIADLGMAGSIAAVTEQLLGLLAFAPVVTLGMAWFPDGRNLSRRWAVIPAMVIAGLLLFSVIDVWLTVEYVYNATDEVDLAFATVALRDFGFWLIVAAMVGSVASLIIRYRRSGPTARRQIRWVLWGSTVGSALGIGMLILGPPIGSWGVPTMFTLIFTAYSIAIWRHQLFDIDVVIARSLTYLSLVALITAVYAVVVVAIPRLLVGEVSDGLGPPLVATAVVAVSFEPARRWIARRAEQLVYGQRATPLEVLSQLTTRLSSSAEHGTEALARLVARGSGAERAVVWSLAGDTLRPHGWWPEGQAAPAPVRRAQLAEDPQRAVAPIRHGDEVLGAISLTKHQAEPVTAGDRDLLDDVAANSGPVLRNLGVQAELEERADQIRTSRRRLVAARDAERHRLERDLHDGAQQHVVALKVKLDVAKAMAARDDRQDLAAQLSELSDQAQEAVDALRQVSHGIYPPLLQADGLGAALGSLASPDGLQLRIDTGGIDRLSRRAEETLYFSVRQLVEAVGQAGGQRLDVDLSESGPMVSLSATTDVTIEAEAVTAMLDRVDAVDGTLVVTAEDQGQHIEIKLEHRIGPDS